MATWAALFDWDWVIIDSARAHKRSWERLAEDVNRPLPDDHFLRGFGMRNEVIFPDILQWSRDPDEIHQWSQQKESLYREVIREEGVTILPGVIRYLKSLQEANIPCVIGTSTQRANVEFILEMTELRPFFQDMVTSEDVSHGKPDPEVFLKAAERAGLPPENCVVFEDALYGIQAAKAGGMAAVGVLTTHPGGFLKGADRLVAQLDELPLDGRFPL
jgi:beta-phosphoglucomutase family hydrolase